MGDFRPSISDLFHTLTEILPKKEREWREYCWTCTPSSILYCIKTFDLEHCIYLDADLFFYKDPAILLNELNGKAILLTEHNYSKNHEQTENSGKYCVQFMYFKNNKQGMKALIWWRDRCLEWCYAYHENGKFGDQKYLDDWLIRFEGVHVLQHFGGGVAPWNIQKFELNKKTDELILHELNGTQELPLIFFHFHHLTFHYFNYIFLGIRLWKKRIIEESKFQHYFLESKIKKLLYKPYIHRLINIEKKLVDEYPGINFNNGPINNIKISTFLKRWRN